MRDSGPRLGTLRLWMRREGMCLAILERALRLLRMEKCLPEAEVELNRCLYFCLLIASNELYPTDPVPPTAECNNQPDPSDELRAAREQKRPDFQWSFRDQYEQDPKHSSKQFVVECKRLGKSLRADRVFNLKYVRDGICRFQDPKWAYAQRFGSGAMVGYCQSMEPGQVLREVNEEARKHSLPNLVPGDSQVSGCDRLEHTFERSFNVSPFRLIHLWIDLRQPGIEGTSGER